MITSKDNDKLKLVRKLRDRKHRDRERLFLTEGEDLLESGIAAGHEPEFVLVAGGTGVKGEEVEPNLLASASALGSGTRAIAVWRQRWAEPAGPVCTYLHGVADPGNVGAIIRSAAALVDGSVVLGAGCADPYGPKATRASMGAIFNIALARGEVGSTPAPRIALVAHGGVPPGDVVAPSLTLCLGAEREGLADEVLGACDERWTIPVRPGTESLNVAAAGAIALQRISSAGPSGGSS